MDKEKEIQEMAKTHYDCVSLNRECESCRHYKCVAYEVCEEMYNVGYRKADEVRKETAKEILQEVLAYLEYKEYVWFRELCGKYGVER